MQSEKLPEGQCRAIHPALSIFPKRSPRSAFEAIAAKHNDGGYQYDLSQCQITPQNFSPWTPERMRDFKLLFPETQFRLHASLRFDREAMFPNQKPALPWYDLSRFLEDKEGGRAYFKAMGQLNQELGSPDYTLHTGSQPKVSGQPRIELLKDGLKEIEDLMQCRVGIETLYPKKAVARTGRPTGRRHWIDCWDEHRELLEAEIPFVVDLSHLNIVAVFEGRQDDLTKAMLQSEHLIELHLSGNDGTADQHSSLEGAQGVWWEDLLSEVNPKTPWFSEAMV